MTKLTIKAFSDKGNLELSSCSIDLIKHILSSTRFSGDAEILPNDFQVKELSIEFSERDGFQKLLGLNV